MNIEKKIIQQIDLANRRHKLLGAGDSLVVGTSGGPDSTALLFILSKLKHKYGLKIAAAHLNHGLFKRQASRHAALAKKTAEALNLPFYLKTVNLRMLAKKSGRSLEEQGRLERYRFFEWVSKKTGARKIVTAHTLDDQAETMLLRILRGSGLRGLKAIPFKREQGGHLEVVRPLLSTEKKDLLLFLRKNGISYCVDESNKSLDFTRNRLRHRLLPLILKDFNPGVKQSLSNLQSVCFEAQDFLEKFSQRALYKCRQKNHLQIAKLKGLHPAIAREVILQALLKKRGNLKRLTHDHIQAIWEIAQSGENHLECQLPGNLKVKKISDKLYFVL